MNEITWLAHGGKGSGWFRSNGHVPGSQGGKIHQFFSKRVGRKRMKDYINSPELNKTTAEQKSSNKKKYDSPE